MRRLSKKEKQFIAWANLVDFGVHSALIKSTLNELKKSLFRQSEDHWEGLCSAFKRLK